MASNEWTMWHLTPDGWIAGDQQFDTGPMVHRMVPPDCLLSSLYKETSGGFDGPFGNRTESWRGSDEKLIAGLLERFGPPPAEL